MIFRKDTGTAIELGRPDQLEPAFADMIRKRPDALSMTADPFHRSMGHFGPKPIRLAWSALVFPSLVLNYAGQAALVLA